MSPLPLRPGEGSFPEDQISVPRAPHRTDPDYGKVLRRRPSVPVVESYRQTVIRIWPNGSDESPVDVVPTPGAETHGPEALFGEGCGPVFVVSGNHAFGRLTMPDEDAATLGGLYWRLEYQGEDWVPSVSSSPNRQWVEKGAVVKGIDEEEALSTAFFHGQDFVFRWDSSGLTPLATREGVDVGGDEPVAVQLAPARTGCPLRCGADGVCKMYGGPWTSSSITAAYFWSQHRALLLDAFGCDVCEGEGGGGLTGGVDLFTPSREGGWQRGAPRTLEQIRDTPSTS
ncbi:hypothetical protein H5392_05355 [Tessaracoccus sp. MC1865]|uniref:hypothetical protein n=1 Tax=Tessaracoccus sp. MC1865 TaxID=2760310 RepID=UPI001601C2FF|nr:hypothetical protein [Tessaracoccus sp. MC1865]MBB1483291.1 hypothetical protein [Tessaracoccus sp. MC1865]QTO37297.1 hypothetical protein J7D54_12855 [Tessaracoccus sp. MC1865]